MCGKFVFSTCCGKSSDKTEKGRTKSADRRRRNKTSRSSDTESEQNENKLESEETTNEVEEDKNLAPNVHMVAPHTIKLLTDIGELKEYKHNDLEDSKLQNDLSIHADILARLENPTKFS